MKDLSLLTKPDFPIFTNSEFSKKNMIYLDHAATSQKPKQVLNALNYYYSNYNANVHRGAHQLSIKATEAFEESREITSKFINASSSREIVFTRNASEAINLVTNSWGSKEIAQGDEVLLTIMEHHSNIVPWQLLSQRTGCVLRFVELTPDGKLDIDDLRSKLNERTKILSLVHISNSLGCCNPIEEIVALTKQKSVLVLLDACQSLAHRQINVKTLGIDFLVGSSHKICGPTGIGFLWGREELLEEMPPFLGGGEMIQEVNLEQSTWADLPHKFEAGTPAIGEAIGMGAAISYLQKLGLENIKEWETKMTKHLFEKLSKIEGIHILGPSPGEQEERGALATFIIKGLHSDDIATLLSESGICIRSGHHCCQPLHRHYGISSSARASLSFTTSINEINSFSDELMSTISFLKKNI